MTEVRADPAWLRGLAGTVRTMSTDLDTAASTVERASADVAARLAAWSAGSALATTSSGIWHDDAAVMSFRVAAVATGLERCAADYETTDHANAENLGW